MRYNCKNWRPEGSICHEDISNKAQVFILADLYHPETHEFYRTARCAQVFCQDAFRYCDQKNGVNPPAPLGRVGTYQIIVNLPCVDGPVPPIVETP